MNISELSRLSGLNTPTIRYYEQIKLLPKAKRKANGYREYSDTDLQQLLLIKQAQQAGFSLAEIKSLLPGNMTIWNHDKLIESLNQKVSEIEALEKKLAENKQNLITLIQAINDKPDEISCEENAQRLFKVYFPDAN
ncbi:MerR family transcriptional regulator [Alkanindiges illinoisensis]|uniref:MerR family transcriptional regulator n=1 Tax=Alkanindiges illinoisensis TaxID=197183 RepID=UPI000479B1E7|nr:MerR family transcriptional regulator [Alkanindiges illinoisensis]